MFKDRSQAGELLAQKLSSYKGSGAVVLGVPRGGVPVAKAIAEALGLPLDILVTKKIGAPNQEELAIGAVGPKDTLVLDKELAKRAGAEEDWLKKETKKVGEKVSRLTKKLRGSAKYDLKDKAVILVDDGVATGATLEVAADFLKRQRPKKLVLAVPVAARDSAEKLSRLVDEAIILETPARFYAVGQFYQDFPQVSDEEVLQLLQI